MRMKSSSIVLIIIYCVKKFPLIIFLHNDISWNLISSKTLFDRCQGSFVPWNNGFLNPLSLYSWNSRKFGKQPIQETWIFAEAPSILEILTTSYQIYLVLFLTTQKTYKRLTLMLCWKDSQPVNPVERNLDWNKLLFDNNKV